MFLQSSFVMVITALSMCNAFTGPVRHKTSVVSSPLLASLPTIEQLAEDPFMKQVEHGFTLTSNLWSDQAADIQDYLQAQLSHSDGIRGFMVSYLTADESPADQPEIPKALWGALQMQMESDAVDDLVSLTCKQNKVRTERKKKYRRFKTEDLTILFALSSLGMNVVMPTAMISMHQTPELSAGSARTAERGIRILQALYHKFPAVQRNVASILAVANNSNDVKDAQLHQYWSQFFEKWGYKQRQLQDITNAMEKILGNNDAIPRH